MKKIIAITFAASLGAFSLSSCTSTQVGTVAGGAAGAGLGYAATGGSPWGTIVGGGLGAFVGNQIGQAEDRRYYVYRRGYYPYYY